MIYILGGEPEAGGMIESSVSIAFAATCSSVRGAVVHNEVREK